MEKSLKEIRKDARSIFYAALKAVDPAQAVKRWLHLEENILKIGRLTFPLSKIRKIYVVGAGKAGAPMANALEEILGDRIEQGLINVKYGHSQKLAKIPFLIKLEEEVPRRYFISWRKQEKMIWFSALSREVAQLFYPCQ